MAISITIDNDRTTDPANPPFDPLIEDESLGTQTLSGTLTPASTDTGNEIDVTLTNPVGGTLGGFLTPFTNLLNNVGNLFTTTFGRTLNDAQRVFAAANDGASSAADFVKVTVTNGETISDLFFSDSAGAALNGDAATGVFTTVDNLQVYLWSAGDYCIATTSSVSASAGRIVAAFYLDDTDPNHLQAQVQMVTFEALKHSGTTNSDDAINFSNVLQVSAAGTQSFDFDALHSSGGIWVAVGNDSGAILVSGYSLDVDTKGKIEPGSNKIAVSQGGTGTTIGVNNQLFDNVGEKAVFTLVGGLDVFGSADSGILSDYVIDQNKPGAEGINYTSYLNVVGAGIFVSQSQGNDAKDFGIDLTHAGGVSNTPEIGLDYIGTEPSGAFIDDSAVNVATVTVKAGDGHILGTWVLGADPDGAGPLQANGATVSYAGANVQITISTNHIDVNGVLNDYTVSWTCAAGSTFNRFILTDDGTGKFDVGRVDLLNGVSAHAPVGGSLVVQDDGPSANGTAVTGTVDEDGATVVTGNPGGPGDDSSSRTATGSIAGIFSAGTDGVGSYQLSTVTSGITPSLTSKGGTVLYNVNTTTQTLTGYVEVSGAGFDAAVDRTVFTLALSGTNNGTYTFTLIDQLDHAAPAAGTAFENEIAINLGSVLQVVDGDGDTATATADKLVITVDDDSPEIKSQIVSGVVDFTSGSFVTSSLNGSVGFDENNATNQSAGGTKTYTFTSYTGDGDSPFSSAITNLFPGIHAVLSTDGTTVNYYSTAGTGDPLYQIVLGQSGAGTYTFTAQQNAPDLSFNFDFGNMPANQNLFGLIAANEANIDTHGTPSKADDTLPDGGILIIAKGVDLLADNSYSNISQTVNTSNASKISGATIGISNQAFEGGTFNPTGADTRGDAAYFVYVKDPYVSSTSGLPKSAGGLTSTTADDADTIKFTGLKEASTASVTMVQAQLQGSPFVGMKIEAFHHTNENLALDDTPTSENRDFALNPIAGATSVPITSVRVYQIDQNIADPNTQSGFKETLVEQWDYVSDGDPLHHTIDSASTGVVASAFNGLVSGQGLSFVDLTGMQNNMRIEFDTATQHDTALITNIQGAFDLGAYSISQSTVIPDLVFDYSVKVTDYDGDVYPGGVSTTVDDFSVTVNSSGTINLVSISTSDLDTLPTQPTRVVSGFTSGTDKLDFNSVSGTFTAESGTHATSLTTFINAADGALNGTTEYYFDTFGGNGYLAYDDNGTGITALIQLNGVTSLSSTDLI